MSSHQRSFSLVVCSLLTLLPACSSTSTKQEVQPGVLAKAQPSSVLSDAFTLFEQSHGEKNATPLDRVLVDYKSTVLVQPDIQKIREAVGRSGRTGDAGERAHLARMQEGAAFLGDGLASTLQLIAENESATREFLATPREGGALQSDPRWRSLAQRQKAIVDRLVLLSETYVSTKEAQGKWRPGRSPEELGLSEEDVGKYQDSVSALYEKLSPAAGVYDPVVVTRIANELTPILQERVAAFDRAVAESAPEAQVTMEAMLVRGNQSVPISIDPYTYVETTGAQPKSARVGIPNKDDLARVKAAYDQYAKLAQSLNELRDLAKDKEALAKARDEILAVIQKRLESLKTGLENTLKELAQNAELATLKTLVEQIQKEIGDVVKSVKDLVQAAPTRDPFALIDGVLSTLQGAKKIGQDLQQLEQQLKDLPETLKELPKPLVARARELLAKEGKLLLDDLEGLDAASNAAPVGALVSALRQLSQIAQLPGFGDLKTAVVSVPFGLDQAPTGTVNLAGTVAESGDRLEIRQTVALPEEKPPAAGGGNTPPPEPTKPQEPPKQPSYHASQHLEVRKYGLYTTYNAQLIFYDRLEDGSHVYSAAPGVYYNFHYRPAGGTTFFDVVAPGIGFSVLAPSFEEGTELAAGAQITLLNDVVQFGYGRNLSIDDDPNMLFFGFDLVQAYREMK